MSVENRRDPHLTGNLIMHPEFYDPPPPHQPTLWADCCEAFAIGASAAFGVAVVLVIFGAFALAFLWRVGALRVWAL